ncbi:MAG: hypothetical protein HY897_02500 [Deltaproteobacteria bacterium]|nr:hypothetical protein [Deltaproteobacteria bacterium]
MDSPIAVSVRQGSYEFSFSVTDNNTQQAVQGTATVFVENSVLSLGAGPASVLAGATLSRALSNDGAVPTNAAYWVALKNAATGESVTTGTGWNNVPEHGSVGIDLYVPSWPRTGNYLYEYTITNWNTNEQLQGSDPVTIQNSDLSVPAGPPAATAGGSLERQIANQGPVATTASYTFAFRDPASGQVVSSASGSKTVPAIGTAAVQVPVPSSLARKSYDIEYQVTDGNTGEVRQGTDPLFVQNSALRVTLPAGPLVAGSTGNFSVMNDGEVATTFAYAANYVNISTGIVFATYSGNGNVAASGQAAMPLPVPSGIEQGTYRLRTNANDARTGILSESEQDVSILASNIVVSSLQGQVAAGAKALVGIDNAGGAAGLVNWTLNLEPVGGGAVLASNTGSAEVQPGSTAVANVDVPEALAAGSYQISVSVQDTRFGLSRAAVLPIQVEGADLSLSQVSGFVMAGETAAIDVVNNGGAPADYWIILAVSDVGGNYVGYVERAGAVDAFGTTREPLDVAPFALRGMGKLDADCVVLATGTHVGQSLGIAIQGSELAVSIGTSNVVAGESLTATVQNIGEAASGYSAEAKLKRLSGEEVAAAIASGPLGEQQSEVISLPVPSGLVGQFEFSVAAVDSRTGKEVRAQQNVTVTNADLVVSFETPLLSAGVASSIRVTNQGTLATDFNYEITLGAGGLTQPVSLGLGSGHAPVNVQTDVSFSLPVSVRGGQYDLISRVTAVATGVITENTFALTVLNSDLDIALGAGPYLAGQPLSATINNRGPVETAFAYFVEISGGGLGQPIRIGEGTGAIGGYTNPDADGGIADPDAGTAGATSMEVAILVPLTVPRGTYEFKARVTAQNTGVETEFVATALVENAELSINPPAGTLFAGGWSMLAVQNAGAVGTPFSYAVTIFDQEHPEGLGVLTGSGTVAANNSYDVAFQVPASLLRGNGTLAIRAVNGNTGVATESSSAHAIENAELSLTLPAGTLQAGTWGMFTVANAGLVGTPFSYFVKIADAEHPEGLDIAAGDGNVAAGNSYDAAFLVPLGLLRGDATLTVRTVCGNTGLVTESSSGILIENAELSITLPIGPLQAGGGGIFTVGNVGAVGTPFSYVVEISGGQLARTVRAAEGDSAVAGNDSADVGFVVPVFIPSGQYTLSTRVVAGNTGLISDAVGEIAIENAVLSVSVPDTSVLAGSSVEIHVANSGPVGTAYSYRVTVWHGGARPPSLFAGAGTVGANMPDAISIAVPADAASGTYLLTVQVENGNTGARSEGEFEISVLGAGVLLDEVLDKSIYLTTDSITSTTNIQNGAIGLPDSTLDLMILRRKPGTTDWPMLNRDPAHRSTASIAGYIRRPASVWFDLGTFTPSAPLGDGSEFFGMMGSPIAGDVDGDGINEVVMTAADASVGLKVFDGRTGQERWRSATVAPSIAVWGLGTPAIADLDGDGAGEIVAVSAYPGSEGVYAFGGDGTLLWTYVTGRPFISAVTVADLDRDGVPEIVVADGVFDASTLMPTSADLHVLNAGGSLRWRTESGEAGSLGASVGDIDGDRDAEIVVGAPSGRVTAFAADGQVKWSRQGSSPVIAPVVLADLDRDGTLDVAVVEDGEFTATSEVYALSGFDGTLRWTSASVLPGLKIASFAAPLLVDIDQDGLLELEVLAVSLLPDSSTGNFSIYMFSSDGQVLNVVSDVDNPLVATPTVADIDGSGKQDLVITLSCWDFDECEAATVAASLPDFTLLWLLPFAAGYASPAIADVTGDGHADVVIRAGADTVAVIGQSPLVPESPEPVLAGVNEAGQDTWDVMCADPLKLDCYVDGTFPFPVEFRGNTYERFRMAPRGEVEWAVTGTSFVVPDLTPDTDKILGALVENSATFFSMGETNLVPTCGFFGAKYLRPGEVDTQGKIVTADQVVFTWFAETTTDALADGAFAACAGAHLNTVQMVVFADGRIRFTKDIHATDPAELRNGPAILDFRGRIVAAGNIWEQALPYDAGPTFMYDPNEETWMPPAAEPFVDELVWQKSLAIDLASGESRSVVEVVPPLGVEPGDYIFRASLLNSLRQLVGRDEEPFKLVAGDISVTLASDKSLYRRGAEVDLVATLENLSIATVSGAVEFYGQDGEFVSEEAFEIAPSSQTDVGAVALAKRVGPATAQVVAFVGGRKVAAAETGFEVAESQVSVNVTAPETVDDQPFEIRVDISNAGPLAAEVRIELDDLQQGTEVRDVFLAAGEATTAAFQKRTVSDGTYLLTLSGDVRLSRSIPVHFGMSAIVAASIEPFCREGVVEIPVFVTNTSAMQGSYPVAFGLTDGEGAEVWNDVRWYPLYPAGSQVGPDRADDLLTFTLLFGTYTLAAETYGYATIFTFVVERLQGVIAVSPPVGTLGENEPFALAYNVTNASLLGGNFSVHFAVSDAASSTVYETTETFALSPAGAPGDGAARTLVLALPAGDFTLTATLDPGNTVATPIHVAAREALTIAASLGAKDHGTLPVALSIVNVGSGPFDGIVSFAVGATVSEQIISIPAGGTATVNVTVDMNGLQSGPQTATATVRNQAGAQAAATNVAFDVVAPVLAFAELPPQTLEFVAGDNATFGFTVQNTGDLPGSATLSFETLGFPREVPVNVAAGASASVPITVPLREDLEELTYTALYKLLPVTGSIAGSDTGTINYLVRGVKVVARVEFDQPLYRAGETAHVDLVIENIGSVSGRELYARVEYADVSIDPLPFVLPADSITIPVDVPLSVVGSQLVYEIYTPATGLSVYLNTAFIQERPIGIQLYTDRQDYGPGDNVLVTIVSDAAGILLVEDVSSGFSQYLDLAAAVPQSVSFGIPETAVSGTRDIRYVFRGIERFYRYNVAGTVAVVSRVTFDKTVYGAADTVRTDFLVKSNEAFEGSLYVMYFAPDDSTLATATLPIAAVSGQVVVSATQSIASAQLGTHKLIFSLFKNVAGTSVELYVGEAFFNVGGSQIAGMTVGKSAYESGMEPVDLTVYFSAVNAVSGTLDLSVDGVPAYSAQVAMESGFSAYRISLDAAAFVGPGLHQVQGMLTVDGLVSTWAVEMVTEDTIPPVLSLAGVVDGAFYNISPVAAVFDATDVNLYRIAGALNDVVYASGTPIAEDADYTLIVTAYDLANNKTTQGVSFVLDTVPPAIDIQGVEEGVVDYPGVAATITVSDLHPDTWSATLDGNPYMSGTPITAVGSHVLVVNAADKATNGASRTVSFTVREANRPPVIVIAGVEDGGEYNEAVTPEISVTDPDDNLSAVTITLKKDDGEPQPYTPGTGISDDGDYTLSVTATDTLNLSASHVVTFALDLTPPAIDPGVVDGLCTIHDVTPVITVTDVHPGSWAATLSKDGGPEESFVSGTTVSAEGSYVLAVAAEDAFDNHATVSPGFKIDRTAPVVDISGVAEGSYFNFPVAPAVDVDDANLLGSNVTLKKDDQPAEPFVSGTTVTADGSYVLSVTAWDCAGNSTSATVSFVVDRTPPSIVVTGVVDGGTHNLGTAAFITVADANLVTPWTATLNGNPYTSGTPITEEGNYTLAVNAADLAGNGADRTVNFAIAGMALPEFRYAICATGSIAIQNNALVRSKNCTTGQFGDFGDVGADGNVSMSNNATVRGMLAGGGNLSMGNNSHLWGDAYLGGAKSGNGVVHGSISYPTPDPAPCACDYDLAALLAEKEQYNNNAALAGDPAIAPYLVNGGLELPNNAHATLPAGGYYLDHVTLNNNAVLGADDGDVYLYVRHSLVMSNNSRLNSPCASGPMFRIYAGADTAAGEQFTFVNNTETRAVVYAPLAAVEFKNNATFCGAVFVKNATLNNNAKVYLDESIRAGPPLLWCE